MTVVKSGVAFKTVYGSPICDGEFNQFGFDRWLQNSNPSAGGGTRRTGSGNHVTAAKGGDTMFPVPGYVEIRQSCNGVRTGSESQTGTSLPLPGIELGQPRILTSSTPSSMVKNPPHSLSPNSEKTSPKDWTKPRRIF